MQCQCRIGAVLVSPIETNNPHAGRENPPSRGHLTTKEDPASDEREQAWLAGPGAARRVEENQNRAQGSWAAPDTRRLRTQRPLSPLPRGTTPQRDATPCWPYPIVVVSPSHITSPSTPTAHPGPPSPLIPACTASDASACPRPSDRQPTPLPNRHHITRPSDGVCLSCDQHASLFSPGCRP